MASQSYYNDDQQGYPDRRDEERNQGYQGTYNYGQQQHPSQVGYQPTRPSEYPPRDSYIPQQSYNDNAQGYQSSYGQQQNASQGPPPANYNQYPPHALNDSYENRYDDRQYEQGYNQSYGSNSNYGQNYSQEQPNSIPGQQPGPDERGFLGAVAGGAAGAYGGHKLHHGVIGGIGGAIAGSMIQDHYKDKKKEDKKHEQQQQQQQQYYNNSSHPHGNFAGNFSASSDQISLDKDYDLIASCADVNNHKRLSSVSLNDCLTNDFGSLKWARGGNFRASARNVRLADGGRILEAELDDGQGGWKHSAIYLDEKITNDDGELRFLG